MEEQIHKKKQIGSRKQAQLIQKYNKAQTNPQQGYKATFIEDTNQATKNTFQTPDGQGEKLTELFDDNSHAPVTGSQKIPTNTIPTKATREPNKMDFTVDIFDTSPIVPASSQIKLNLTGKPTTNQVPNQVPTTKPTIYTIPVGNKKKVPPFVHKPGKKAKRKMRNALKINALNIKSGNTPSKIGAPKHSSAAERPNLTVINPNKVQSKPTKPDVVPAQSSKTNQGANPTQANPASNPGKTIPETKSVQTPAQTQKPAQSTAQTQKPAQSTAQTQKPAQATVQTQPTGFKGRMTAASFLTHSVLPIKQTFSIPKGIPKSFLMNRQDAIPSVPVQLAPQPELKQTATLHILKSRRTGHPRHIYRYEDGGETSASIDQSSGLTPYQGQDFGKKASAFSQGGQSISQGGQSISQGGQSISQSGQDQQSEGEVYGQVYVNIDNSGNQYQQYSPSDVYADSSFNEGLDDDSERSRSPESRSKRLSAFQRLGPPAQAKKPKLTINLLVNKDQSVREVVDTSSEDEKFTPVHLRADIQTSTDETVMKYFMHWPYKNNMPPPRRQVTVRHTKYVTSTEMKQMEEAYDRDNAFFLITVTGYPSTWCKENVLDALLESIRDKSFIPCFIEFLKHECKFLVIRSKPALLAIHKLGLVIRKEDVELYITISQLILSTNQIDFIPRLVLRKRLILAIENEYDLNLSEFTTKSDVSHFIYFPLNRVTNQSELINLQSSVPWLYLTKLNLSHNRITTLSGFSLESLTPRLKYLDVSYNYIDDMGDLIQCRRLPLNSILLEGNPVCLDYMQEMYVKVLRMMFPALRDIDGVKLTLPGEFPKYIRNYCPEDARVVAEKVLEVMFPLLDSNAEDRLMIENMYDVNALMTVTFMYKLRYGQIYKEHRSLFNRARWLEEGDTESIQGAPAIAKVIYRWPILCHDPTTFTVDVLHHTITTTIIRISGIMKVTAESLAENEHLLSFTRTLVLNTIDCVEYKITNELVHWDLPDKEITRNAFRQTTGRSMNLNLKLESPPDEDLKENLLEIFMKLTELDKKSSIRCLELKEWHLKNALEYFYKLLKLDNLELLLA